MPPLLALSANYAADVFDDVIRVVDLGIPGTLSVTNNAEAVVRRLAEQGFDIQRVPIVYRDSAGRWDGLVVDKAGEFDGFVILRGRTFEDAVRRLRGLHGKEAGTDPSGSGEDRDADQDQGRRPGPV